MSVGSKILMDNDCVFPLADGTCGKITVSHASYFIALKEKRDCGISHFMFFCSMEMWSFQDYSQFFMNSEQEQNYSRYVSAKSWEASIPSASLRTSSTVSTGTNVSSPRTSCGTSWRSRSFSFGRMTFLIPARCAARIFSFIPPTGSTHHSE